jgi:hypothetical protein
MSRLIIVQLSLTQVTPRLHWLDDSCSWLKILADHGTLCDRKSINLKHATILPVL